MIDLENIISKSLDAVDELASKSEELSKAMEEPTPEDVVENAPEVPTQGAEQEEDVEEEPTEDTPDVDEDPEMEKSLMETLEGNDSVKKALEVSEFLQELSKGISSVIDSQTGKLAKSLHATELTGSMLAKSFEGIVKSQKAVMDTQSYLIKSIRELSGRLNAVEEQPLVRKSISGTAQPVNKSFAKSTGIDENPSTLSKSEAVEKLTQAYMSGNTGIMGDLLALEGTGDMGALSQTSKSLLGIQ